MITFQSLMEALNQRQINYVMNSLGGYRYNPNGHHHWLFESHSAGNRITIPIHSENVEADETVKKHLAKHGWRIHDYVNGMAVKNIIDQNGNEKPVFKKIGKILNEIGADKIDHNIRLKDSNGLYTKPQSILKFFNNDPVRNANNSPYDAIISRDVEDIAGMSSGRRWEKDSCMRLPYSDTGLTTGVEHGKIKDDLKNGTLVAYSVKRGDTNLENVTGRTLIKAYDSGDHTIYRAVGVTYGNPPHGFTESLNRLLEKHYPKKEGKIYKLRKSLYSEGETELSPLYTGFHRLSRNDTRNYDENGSLHDYTDENGKLQPALFSRNQVIAHYSHGKLHSDTSEPAKIDITNGIASHYKNGILHSNLNKPTEYLINNNGFKEYEKYYQYGLLHREGNKPASHYISNNGYIVTTYNLHGFEHRDDGGISGKEIHPPSSHNNNTGLEIYRRKKWDLYHTDSFNKPSYHSINTVDTGDLHSVEVKKQTHQNGKLESIDDKPSEIHQTYHNGKLIKEAKFWHKDGEMYRDNDKPIAVITVNGKVETKRWNRELGSSLPKLITKNDKMELHEYNETPKNGVKILSIAKFPNKSIVEKYKTNDDKHIISTNGNMFYIEHTDDDNNKHSMGILKKDGLIHIIPHSSTYRSHYITIDKKGNCKKHEMKIRDNDLVDNIKLSTMYHFANSPKIKEKHDGLLENIDKYKENEYEVTGEEKNNIINQFKNIASNDPRLSKFSKGYKI